VAYLLPAGGELGRADWSQAQVAFDVDDLERSGEPGAYYAELPSELGGARSLSSFKKEFEDYLYYNSTATLWHNPHLDLFSRFDESEDEFQRRCRKAAEEARDQEAEKIRDKYEAKLDKLEDRLERERRELEEDKAEHSARKQEELLSGVESVFNLLGGRRSSRRLSTASRKRRMTSKAKADIEESEEEIRDLQEDIEELEAEAREDLEELDRKWRGLIDEVEEIEVHPRRADVQISLFALTWVPRWEVVVSGQTLSVPAIALETA
jgi:vacuolar-type H+-ATPase subunit I/STV1